MEGGRHRRRADRVGGVGASARPCRGARNRRWRRQLTAWIRCGRRCRRSGSSARSSGLSVDSRDHVWILQRPWSLATDEKAQNPDAPCCHPAPPVMEFDAAGNYIQGWGGEGEGYEWPADEHAIHVDYKGNVWISSAGGPRLRDAQGEPDPEVHAGGEVPAADRPSRHEQGEPRHRQLQQRRRHLRLREDQRGVRRRRLRQPPRDRARRRHRQVQADVGRVRQSAGRCRAERPTDEGPGRAAVQPRPRRPRVRRRPRLRGRSAEQPDAGVHARRQVPARDVRRAQDQAARHVLFDRVLARPAPGTSLPGRCRQRPRPHLRPQNRSARSAASAGSAIMPASSSFFILSRRTRQGNVYTAEVGGGRRVQKFVRQGSR